MNRSLVRRRDGLTLVELLVTIVLAGIVFAAMVPAFISAQSSSGKDNLRAMSLNIARDKMEKARQLDYDQVDATLLATSGPTPSNLSNTGVFGTRNVVSTGGGATKTFDIAYTVTPVNTAGSAVALGTEDHKVLAITVTWEGAPKPQQTSTLQTDVSREYFGPTVNDLFSPDATQDTDNAGVGTITAGGNVRFIAHVAVPDQPQMNWAGATVASRGYIDFSITDLSGNKVASSNHTLAGDISVTQQLSPSIPVGVTGQVQWTWNSALAVTGDYLVSAVATSPSGASGNLYACIYHVQASNLPSPGAVAATAADASVTVTWNAVGGAHHYQVWRGTTSGGETKLVDNLSATSYVDNSVTNGTTYFYQVVAVDSSNVSSARSLEVSATPTTTTYPDNVPPSVPTNVVFSNVNSTSMQLDWTASTDTAIVPAVASGVKTYEIYRTTNTSSWPATATATVTGSPPLNPPTPTFNDSNPPLSPGTTYYYKLKAIDAAGNASAFSAVFSAATTTVPTYGNINVKFSANGNKTMNVYVQNIGNGLYYSTSGGSSTTASTVTYPISNKTAPGLTWSNLPTGAYNVYATYGTQKTQSVTVTTGATPSLTFSWP